MFLRQVRHIYAVRCYSSASTARIEYSNYGDPRHVLELKSDPVPVTESSAKQLQIRFMASPINPADINTIQGVYPIKPPLPAIGGNEGVAEVVKTFEGSAFRKGDWVVPNGAGFGTWRTHAICSEEDVFAIPSDIPLISAATMSVNPCTAYRMLHDFAKLAPGDVIIQNGANSGVGQAVIQIAADLGLRTVNIIRDRDNVDKLIAYLSSLGATHVTTDKAFSTNMKSWMEILPKPKLAFNCVGGKAVLHLVKYLEKEGTIVTYGGMSRQPLALPTGPLIFNDICARGFWMTRWTANNKSSPERQVMWAYLAELIKRGKLNEPKHNRVSIENFKEAVDNAMSESKKEKQILVM